MLGHSYTHSSDPTLLSIFTGTLLCGRAGSLAEAFPALSEAGLSLQDCCLVVAT